MKVELSCNIIKDILPNYIERLTSGDTKVAVTELKFLKKIRRTRILAVIVCIILTLALSYTIYESEYKYSIDKAILSGAITEFMDP